MRDAIANILAEIQKAYPAIIATQEYAPKAKRQLIQERIEREPSRRAVLHEACKQWVISRDWPSMNADDAVLIWERLSHAVQMGRLLHHFGFQVEKKTQNELLNFLLIDAWDTIGSYRLAGRLKDMR